MERRDFLKTGLAGMACAGGAANAGGGGGAVPVDDAALDAKNLLRIDDPGERRGDMLYRPLGKTGAPVTPIECLHYAMNLPTSVVITGIDKPKILDQAFEAVKTFKPMNAAEVAALVAKTAPYAKDGTYELFKTTGHFDGTAKSPEWLGGETDAVKKIAPPA